MLSRRPRTSGLLRVEIRDVRSLPKREAARRQFWALCLCRPGSRSWLGPMFVLLRSKKLRRSADFEAFAVFGRDVAEAGQRRDHVADILL